MPVGRPDTISERAARIAAHLRIGRLIAKYSVVPGPASEPQDGERQHAAPVEQRVVRDAVVRDHHDAGGPAGDEQRGHRQGRCVPPHREEHHLVPREDPALAVIRMMAIGSTLPP